MVLARKPAIGFLDIVFAGLALGAILGTIGFIRIMLWQHFGWYNYGTHHTLVAVTVALALVGVVTLGSLAGPMLPFVLRRRNSDPATPPAPFGTPARAGAGPTHTHSPPVTGLRGRPRAHGFGLSCVVWASWTVGAPDSGASSR